MHSYFLLTKSRFLAGFMALLVLGVGSCSAKPMPSITEYSYEVVNIFPHDVTAFTQGLLFKDGFLYESTGLRGRSSIRKVTLQTGEVQQQVNLPNSMFGEGLTVWQDNLIHVTWKSGIGFVLKTSDLSAIAKFNYQGEGWGLTRSDTAILMSDGSAQIRVLDPKTMTELRRIDVTVNGAPVPKLNELEWVDGRIYANIWQTDTIAIIEPDTGNVSAWIDLNGLLQTHGTTAQGADVLNGIAYDPKTKRLFVTGKLWPNVFEINLIRSTHK